MGEDRQPEEQGTNKESSRKEEESVALAPLSITMDKRADLAVSVFTILFGIFTLITARKIKMGLVIDPITPRGLPNMMGILLIVGGLFLAVQQLRNWSMLPGNLVPEEGQEDEAGYPISATRAMAIMVLSGLWEAFLNPLGFLIVTPLYLVACCRVMGVKSWVQIILYSLIYDVCAWAIFGPTLGVRFPLGPLQDPIESLLLSFGIYM